MQWDEYEEITKNIYEALGKKTGVKIVGWGNNFKYKGHFSQVDHQIDVLTEHTDGIHTYLPDIECKYWDQNISKDTVMKVESIVRDCKFHKGVIVTKKGFTPDAVNYAEYANIGLVILREPTEEDWKGRIKNINLVINAIIPQVIGYLNQVTEPFLSSESQYISTDKYYYLFPDGSRKTIQDVIKEFFSTHKFDKDNPDQIFEEKIEFPDGTLLYADDLEKPVVTLSVTIKGKYNVIKSEALIKGEDTVWLMMRSIFENKEYSIDKTGKIRENR